MFKNAERTWPLLDMMFIGMYPFVAKTFLQFGHAIQRDSNAIRARNIQYFSWLIKFPESFSLNRNIRKLKIADEHHVNFFVLVLLFQREHLLWRNEGYKALIDRFNVHQIPEVTTMDRKEVV